MKKELKDRDSAGPLSGRDPEPDKSEKKETDIASGAGKKTAREKPSMTVRLLPGRKLPWLIACQQRDPSFTMPEFRDLQRGQPVKVTKTLGDYLLQWCEEIKTV